MVLPVPAAASRPTRAVRRTLYAIGICVWTSGVLWWIFDKYLLRRTDVGLSENPAQVWWLRLHAASATVMVWLFGYLSALHIQRNWKGGARRSSGLLFVMFLSVLTVSGYLLYYVDDERPEQLITQVHWIVGLCAPLGFLLHWRLGRRLSGAAIAQAPATSPASISATPEGRSTAGLAD